MLNEKVSQLENQLVTKNSTILNLKTEFSAYKRANAEKISIGEKFLAMQQGKKWAGSIKARRLCGLAFAQLPAASAKYLSQAIPACVAAFFCDVGFDEFVEDLEFIADLTPCDKTIL